MPHFLRIFWRRIYHLSYYYATEDKAKRQNASFPVSSNVFIDFCFTQCEYTKSSPTWGHMQGIVCCELKFRLNICNITHTWKTAKIWRKVGHTDNRKLMGLMSRERFEYLNTMVGFVTHMDGLTVTKSKELLWTFLAIYYSIEKELLEHSMPFIKLC